VLSFNIIAAIDSQLGIGITNQLPWHLSQDLTRFKEITTRASLGQKNVVIMGKNTWISLPEKVKPLSNRINIVISSDTNLDLPENVYRTTNLDDALDLKFLENIDQYFVIGGATLYQKAIAHSACHYLYLTRIQKQFNCDTFFPQFEHRFVRQEQSQPFTENGINYYFEIYRHI